MDTPDISCFFLLWGWLGWMGGGFLNFFLLFVFYDVVVVVIGGFHG